MGCSTRETRFCRFGARGCIWGIGLLGDLDCDRSIDHLSSTPAIRLPKESAGKEVRAYRICLLRRRLGVQAIATAGYVRHLVQYASAVGVPVGWHGMAWLVVCSASRMAGRARPVRFFIPRSRLGGTFEMGVYPALIREQDWHRRCRNSSVYGHSVSYNEMVMLYLRFWDWVTGWMDVKGMDGY